MNPRTSDTLEQFIHLPVFLAAIMILSLMLALPAEVALEHVYEPPYLLFALNGLFITAVSFWIAWQALRGYLASGFIPFLLLGCALLSAGGAATLAGLLIKQPDGVNDAVTVYNLGFLLSAALHFANALLLEGKTERVERIGGSRKLISSSAYLAVFLVVGGIWAACRHNLMPRFYVPGVGPETIREVVLTVTILVLGMSAYRIESLARLRQAGYLRWYGFGLALIALGLFGVAIGIPGSPLCWTGRATQYVGNLYLFAAAVYAFGTARQKGYGWEEAARDFFREPEGRYRTLVESARSAIVSVDWQGKVFLWNPSAETLFGYTADEVMGQMLTGLIAPPGSREELERLTRTSPRGVYELTLCRKDGGEFAAEFTIYGLTGRDEKSLNIRDITERKLAERSIKRQAAVLAGINQIFQEVISSRTEEELGEVCLAVAEEITESRIGFLGEIDSEERLHVINFSNPSWESCRVVHPADHRKQTVVLKIHGLYGLVLREGRSLLTNDPASEPDRAGLPPGHPPLSSFLGVPLKLEGKTLGMVAVGNRDGGYGPDEQDALEALAPAVIEAFQRKRAEESLRESEEKYRSLFANLTSATLMIEPVCDGDGRLVDLRYLMANDAVTKHLGKTPDEMVGKLYSEVFVYPGRNPVFERYEKVLSSGKPFRDEIFLPALDRYYDIAAYRPIPGRLALVLSDITERKQTEAALIESKAKLETVIESMNDAVFVSDKEGNFIDFNEAFATYHKFRNKEECYKKLSEYPGYIDVYFADGTLAPLDQWAVPRALRGETVPYAEYILRRKDTGETWWGSYSFSPIQDKDGSIVGSVVVGRDITERKAAEEALKEARNSLEQRVRERTKELQNLAEQLEQSRHELRKLVSELVMTETNERKRFAGVLHDDIAQVLALVRMQLDALENLSFQQSKPALAKAKALLTESILRTRALMNDLGNPVLFDLGLKSAIEALASRLMAENSLRIHCEIPDEFKSLHPDVKAMLYQIVQELLNNVVKHGRAQNAHVLIEKEGGSFRVKVTDDGVGFDPQMIGAPTAEGGFGLYSIRERLTAVDGNLRIESAPGRGAVVMATMPAELD